MSRLQLDKLSGVKVSVKHLSELERLVKVIDAELDEYVASVSVYGSAARGEWDASTSDINVLVLLESSHFDSLGRVGQAFARARKRARVVPMVMTVDELQRASDVFCVKFASIKQDHVCVLGRDLLEGLEIEDDAVRFVCEFQLRNVVMRMRQFYLQNFGASRLEQALLMRFFSTTLFPLRALAVLRGHAPGPRVFSDFREIERALDVDTGVLARLARVHRDGNKLADAELMELYEGFNALVQRAADVADRHESSR